MLQVVPDSDTLEQHSENRRDERKQEAKSKRIHPD